MPIAATSAIDRIEKALEDLRFQFLHSSSGLPLPSIRQLSVLARFRPSAIQSLPHNVIPTWSPEQTKIFGEVFLRKAREVSLSLALPLNVYQCAPSSSAPAASIPPSSNSKKRKKVEVHHVEITNAFRKGVDTRQIAQSHQILEEKVFQYLIEADQYGIDVNWDQLKLDRRLYESVGLAVDVVKEMEGGQRDPLALDFPVATLKQLLPDASGIAVSAALCKLRHQCQYGISPPSLRNMWTAPVSSSVPSSSSRSAAAAAVPTNNSARPMPLQRHQQQQHPQAKSDLWPQGQAAVATHSNSSNTRPVQQQTKSRLGAQGQSATSSAATVAVATTTKAAASTINQATAMEVVGKKRCPEVLLGPTSGGIRAMPIQQQQQQQQQRRSYLNLQRQSTLTSSLAVAAVAAPTKAGASTIKNQATEMEVMGKKRCPEVLKTLPSEVPPYKAARRPLGNLQHSQQQQHPPEPFHFPQSQPTPLPPPSSSSLSSCRPPPSRTSSWPPPPTLPSSNSSLLDHYQHPRSRPASSETDQSNSNKSRIIPAYQPNKASSSSPALPLMTTATAAASHPPPLTAIDSRPPQLHAPAHLHHPTSSSAGATTGGQSHPSSTASLNPTIAPYKPGSNRGPPSSSAAAAPALSCKGSVPSISSASTSHPPPPPSSLSITSDTTLPPAAHPPPHQQQQQQYQQQQHGHYHQQQKLQQQPQQQHQHQQQHYQQQQQQQQQEQQAITAAPMSLIDIVVDALQANASEGLTVQEVYHQVMMKGRGGGQGISYQAVESCLVDMSDNFEAYIHGGKYNIL